MDKDLRVIVLHDDNISVHGADRFKILPASSMIVPAVSWTSLLISKE